MRSTSEVVLLCEPGVLQGRKAVGESADRLVWQIPNARFIRDGCIVMQSVYYRVSPNGAR